MHAAQNAQQQNVIEYGSRRVLVTLAVILATMLEIIDTTIINVALPTIQGNIGANLEEGSLIVTGYIVANVVVIPLTPWLAQRFGRRNYFFASIAIFTAASVMCGLSHTLYSLLFWRVVQGAGGGGLISTSQAILRDTYPPDKQGLGQGIFAMGAIVGPTLGPTIGGLITDNLSWEWVFFINLPLGILAMTLVALYLRNPAEPRKSSLDGLGVAFLAVGLGSLQYVLDQGQEKDWFSDQLIVALAVIATVCIIGFFTWELFFARKPIVDLSVLRYRSVAAGSALGIILGVTLTGSLVTLPQFVQGQLGFTATLSGELIFLRAIAVMLLTPLSVRLATDPRVDLRLLIGFGFFLIAVANLMQAQITTTTADFSTFAASMMVGGCGLAFTFVPLSLAVFAGVAQRDVPGASAFFNLARQLGGSVGTAALVTLLARSIATHHYDLARSIRVGSLPVASYIASNGSAKAVPNLNALVDAQAATLAYADASRATGYSTLLLLPLVFLIRRREPVQGPAPALELG